MQTFIIVLFLIAALINLLPGLGVLSASRLESFYGVALQDPNLAILMRHRAVAIAIVGALLAVAAFQPSLRTTATVAGLASMLSFILVAWIVGEPNALLRRVAAIDAFAVVVLVAAAVLDHRLASGAR